MRALIAIVCCAAAFAAQAIELGATRVAGESIQWVEPTVALPAGAKIALLEGFPAIERSFTIRVQLPARRGFGPYATTDFERVTVLSGRVRLTTATQGDAEYGAGSFFSIPPTLKHSIDAIDDAVLQVTTVGPWLSTAVAGPSPDATIPATAAGLSLRVTSIDPASGGVIDIKSVAQATVEYAIENFHAGYYEIVPMVELRGGGMKSATGINRVELARDAGKLTFDIPLADALTDANVKRPLRLWFVIMRKVGDNRAQPILRSETIEYIPQ